NAFYYSIFELEKKKNNSSARPSTKLAAYSPQFQPTQPKFFVARKEGRPPDKERHYLLQEMKILEANVSALTNFEVLDFIRAKGASKDPTRVIAKVAMSEYKVYDYLVNTAAGSQTRESVKEYLTSIKKHELSQAEVLNVLNIRPAAEVELFHIIEDCTVRFPDEEIAEIVELVEKTLPARSNEETSKEISEGEEETETQKYENGNEIRQDQIEDGEQMDTS
ncbi:hypothetical protein KIW84_035066, partial [Lathyrus oleraceus]